MHGDRQNCSDFSLAPLTKRHLDGVMLMFAPLPRVYFLAPSLLRSDESSIWHGLVCASRCGYAKVFLGSSSLVKPESLQSDNDDTLRNLDDKTLISVVSAACEGSQRECLSSRRSYFMTIVHDVCSVLRPVSH
jgi:hypothetical protein